MFRQFVNAIGINATSSHENYHVFWKGNDFEGGVAIICAQPGKKIQRSNERTSWNRGRDERVASSPACCRQRSAYAPGYTLFECRLDGNQPIAQVVQVPPDTRDNILPNKACMILETKQSEFGPSSRVVAYPGKEGSGSTCKGRQGVGPISFALESRDQPGGAVACAESVAVRSPNVHAQSPITILETTNGPPTQDGPSSRLTYGPVAEDIVKTSSGSYKPPAFYIQCTTTPEGPIARVTQVPQKLSNSSGDPGTRYETSVRHDGSCPIAQVTQCNKREESCGQQACEYLETRVCCSGPRARALTLPAGASNVTHFTHLDVRPRDNGPTARISQHPANPQMKILNLRDSQRAKTTPICCCDSVNDAAIRSRNPCKFTTTCRPAKARCGAKTAVERRNGLTPTNSELDGRVGPFKYSRIKKSRIGQAPKVCPPHCCPPPINPCPCLPPPCRVQQAPCAPQRSRSLVKKSETPLLWSTSCACPLQPCFKALERPRSGVHPLPGGCVIPKCPSPALPDIAPVQLGPNRLRDYTVRSKTTGSQSAALPRRRSPRAHGKTSKSAKTADRTKKTKNKKTGSRGKSGTAVGTYDKETPKSPDKMWTECPAFASKESQSDSIDQESTYVQCPGFASKGNQSDSISRQPNYVECPAYQTRGNQATIINQEPCYVKCPTYETKRKKSTPRFEEPSYVRCPDFESKKTSETSSVYVPNEDELIRKYPEYFSAKTIENFIACRAKRNGLQDECYFHIPDGVLRMSYEQRKNRRARTLVSNCRGRRRLDNELNDVPETRYCLRSELPVR